METKKFKPNPQQVREALAGCYRLLLQLPDEKESEATSDFEIQTPPVSIIEADVIPEAKTGNVINETA